MNEDSQNWEVLLSKQPQKIIRRLPKPMRKRIAEAIDELSKDQHPTNSKQLIGFPDLYRLRVGDWRIIYTLKNEKLIVLVIRIAPRGDAYKGL